MFFLDDKILEEDGRRLVLEEVVVFIDCYWFDYKRRDFLSIDFRRFIAIS